MLNSFTTSDNEQITINIIGKGSPLIFLHGWTANHNDWREYAEALTDQHTCYCWNARGHGRQKVANPSEASIGRMAQDLRELIQHFELDNPILLGHSMGALTIWEYIHHFGCNEISKLCLVDQSPRLLTCNEWSHGIYGDFSGPSNEAFIRHLEDDFSEAVLRLVADGNNPHTSKSYADNSPQIQKVREYLSKLDPEPLINIWKSLSLVDYREILPKITVPTLLVHGDESQFYSVDLAQYVRDSIPDAQLHIYQGTDHSPHLWQKDRFIEDLRTFTQE